MTRFIPNDIWKVVAQRTKTVGRRRAAIAYVIRNLPLGLQVGDTLVTDASNHAIASGQTSASLLRMLFERGVELFSHVGLHAKLIVLDNTVIVSSANLSGQSVNCRLVEAGIVTDHPGTVAGALSFIEQLKSLSRKLISKRIEILERIPVVRSGEPPPGASSKRRPKVASQSSSWIASIHELTKPMRHEDEAEANNGLRLATKMLADPKSDAAYVCYAKSSNFAKTVRLGDTVIFIWRNDPRSTEPEFVYRHSRVLFCDEGENRRWLYYEERADAEAQRLPWRKFKLLSRRTGIPYSFGINTERRLPEEYSDGLHDLWGRSIGK